MEKRILFVAPSSYPINGPESMVNAKHLYVLSRMGYIVDLVCRGINKRHVSYPSESNSLYFKGLNSINVVSVDTRMNFNTLLRHLLVLFKTGVIYKGADWAYPAIKECESLIKRHQYDFVFTKDYPSEIVGLYVSKKYGLKWIPTWNDPYMFEKYPEPYGYGVNFKESFFRNKLIRQISHYTYCNIFPSERLKNYMLKYMYGMSETRCEIMPHILIDKELEDTLGSPKDKCFNIIHTGSIGKERNPEKFFIALSNTLKNHKDWRIKVTFLGIVDRDKNSLINDLCDKYGLGDVIVAKEPIPYNDCMEFVKKFDLCLIIEAACEEGIFLPSKVADYLQNGKSIMSISPQVGTINDLYKDGVIDYFGEVNSPSSIQIALEQAYTDFIIGKLKKEKNLLAFSENAVINLHKSILEE